MAQTATQPTTWTVIFPALPDHPIQSFRTETVETGHTETDAKLLAKNYGARAFPTAQAKVAA